MLKLKKDSYLIISPDKFRIKRSKIQHSESKYMYDFLSFKCSGLNLRSKGKKMLEQPRWELGRCGVKLFSVKIPLPME